MGSRIYHTIFIILVRQVIAASLSVKGKLHKFVSARLITMVIEVGGVWLLVSVMGLNDMIGKFLTQFIVLILNYVFSKFFVFTTGKSK